MNATTFDAWMAAVDAACWKRYGLSVHDLADCPFADWYDDDMSPSTAAREARKAQD